MASPGTTTGSTDLTGTIMKLAKSYLVIIFPCRFNGAAVAAAQLTWERHKFVFEPT
jgi:hypothetical protein